MPETRLVAQPRTEFGKGAARRLRRAGQVPTVLYGHGAETQHFSLGALELARALKGGANTVLTIEFDGKDRLALPRAITRHPIKDYFEHVDLLTVRRGEKVTVEVPVHVVGEAAPGTLVLHELNTLAIEVDALAIPERLEASIEGAEPGSHVSAADIPLPEGATLIDDPELLIVAVQVAPSAAALEEEVAEELASETEAPEPAEES